LSPQNRVDVEIFGEHYKLKGDATPEYMVRLARYVDQTMRRVMQRNPRLSVHKAAVLSAINIADELLKVLDSREETGAAPEEGNEPGETETGDRQPDRAQGKKKKKKKA